MHFRHIARPAQRIWYPVGRRQYITGAGPTKRRLTHAHQLPHGSPLAVVAEGPLGLRGEGNVAQGRTAAKPRGAEGELVGDVALADTVERGRRKIELFELRECA